jgi:hypothetical protein
MPETLHPASVEKIKTPENNMIENPTIDVTEYGILATPLTYRERQYTSQESLEEYVKCTDHVVGVLDGSIPPEGKIKTLNRELFDSSGKVEFQNEEVSKRKDTLPKPDAVVWLDKSARPVSWMVKEMWDILATPDENGNIPKRPKEVFLNIDREPWLLGTNLKLSEIDTERSNQFEINKIATKDETVRQQLGNIRGLFVERSREETDDSGKKLKVRLTPDNFDEEVWKMPLKSKPNGEKYEHMVIVDEVKSSGATSFISQELLSAALPELTVTVAHWQKNLSGREQLKNNTKVPGWVPVWYSSKDPLGRGVGDLNKGWYMKNDSNFILQRAGQVLSTPPLDKASGQRIKDEKSTQLRKDIKTLTRDLGRRALLFTPSTDRNNEDRKMRISNIGGLSFEQWQKRRGITPRK